MGIRRDGAHILQCSRCQMAAVDSHWSRERDSHVSHRAVHPVFSGPSLAWLAGLAELATVPGAVLDIGCGDGSLLAQFGSRWERFGIEADVDLAAKASSGGIRMIGSDVLAPSVKTKLPRGVSVITAVGILQHLPDLRSAIARAVDLLAVDGLLVFEVPLLGGTGLDDHWLATDMTWYPTRSGIEWLIQRELGFDLAGTECEVRGFASTYIGVVVKRPERAGAAEDLVSRVLTGPLSGLRTPAERRVRATYQLYHAADTGEDARALSRILRASGQPTEHPATSDAPATDIALLKKDVATIREVLAENRRALEAAEERETGLLAEIVRGVGGAERALEAAEERETGLLAEIVRGIDRAERNAETDPASCRSARARWSHAAGIDVSARPHREYPRR